MSGTSRLVGHVEYGACKRYRQCAWDASGPGMQVGVPREGLGTSTAVARGFQGSGRARIQEWAVPDFWRDAVNMFLLAPGVIRRPCCCRPFPSTCWAACWRARGWWR